MSIIDTLKTDISNVIYAGEVGDIVIFSGAYGTLERKAIITVKSEKGLSGFDAVETYSEYLECVSSDIVGVKVNDSVSVRGQDYFAVDIASDIYGTSLIYLSKDKLR
jgi:hypothetical protein